MTAKAAAAALAEFDVDLKVRIGEIHLRGERWWLDENNVADAGTGEGQYHGRL